MLSINMVENVVKERMILEENILYELMRLESLSFFAKLSSEDKIEYIIARANYKIVEWHFLLSLEGNENILEYKKWKKMLLQEFCNEEQTMIDVYRMERKNEQTLGDFIRDVERKGRRLNVNFVDRKKIILRSVPEEALELKYCVRMASKFCKETIEIIEEVEKNFHEEKIQKHDNINETEQNLDKDSTGEGNDKMVQQKKKKIKMAM